MKFRFTSSRQRGDTIVEVLVSLVVISVILVGAFALTRHSNQNVRDSQEHTEALGLLQAQVELLRTAATNGTLRSGTPATFCMTNSAGIATGAAACKRGETALYSVSITVYGHASPSDPTTNFHLNVSWPGIRGNNSSEDMYYKVGTD